MAEYFDHIKRDTIEAGRELVNMREQLLELAALRDNLGNTTPAVTAQLALRGQTLQIAAAREMELTARGTGEAAIGKTITQEAFERLLVGGGRFQTMEGSSWMLSATWSGS